MIAFTQKHKERFILVTLLMIGVTVTVTLAAKTFSQNMLYFFSPSQIIAGEAPKNANIRIGGMVTKGSVQRDSNSLQVSFVVTDRVHDLTVRYTGILPDLFKEGQGVVAIGQMQADGIFVATEVLAKHDENYMPPEVASTLKNK